MQQLRHVPVQLVVELQSSRGLIQQVFIGVVTRHQRAEILLPGPQQGVNLEPGVSVVRIPLGHCLDDGALGGDVLSDVNDRLFVLLQLLLEQFLGVRVSLHCQSLGDVVLLHGVPQILLQLTSLSSHLLNFTHDPPHVLQTLCGLLVQLVERGDRG